MANKTTTAHSQRLRDYGREVREERDAMVEAAHGAFSEITEIAKEQVEERPYTALSGAFALGLLLGGGLPLGVIGFTARAAAGIAIRQMVEGMLPGAAGSDDARRSRSRGSEAAE